MFDAGDARMLAEIGMLAVRGGDLPRADTIFGSLRMLRPESAVPPVGQAIARMVMGRADDAVRLLEPVVLADPDEHAVVLAWRGHALQLAGRSAESQRVLAEAAVLSGEGAKLARDLLECPTPQCSDVACEY